MTETKLKEQFAEMLVFKDLRKTNFFTALSLPSFLRDWLLKRFCDDEGNYDLAKMSAFIKSYLPRKEDWTRIKASVVHDGERVKFLAKTAIDVNIRTSVISFSLPDYGLTTKETIIEPFVWDECKDELASGKEVWGVVELGYRPPDDEHKQGLIALESFRNFCPYTVDLDFYKDARKAFDVHEWIDVLLGAIDYNAGGYVRLDSEGKPELDENGSEIPDEEAKLAMLSRILPFLEKRLNLVEFAPKGTAKSYVFGQVSKYGWLVNGGNMSRAKLFYDIGSRQPGLVMNNDYVAIDEVHKTKFSDVNEMQSALQGYLEQGTIKLANFSGTADAGLVLLGNIDESKMNEYADIFGDLPKLFHESALIDRFHGFIKGWEIPRMNDDLKICGWALNSEYFTTILHLLRDDGSYRAVTDSLVVGPKKSDTRDTEAVKRICTAFLKLLFPNVREPRDIDPGLFKRYCLAPAMKMRSIIKYQMGLLDTEFRGKDIPKFKVAGDEV